MLGTRTTVDCSKGLVYKPTFIDILKLILLWYHRGSNEYGIANNRSITCKGGEEMDPAHKVSTR